MASVMGVYHPDKRLRPQPTTLYEVAAQQGASPSFHELRGTYPRPTRDPQALAQWELDVADGTLIPEFRRVHVGYYYERIVPEEIDVTTFGGGTQVLKFNRVECREPRYEERLVWVRNPDLQAEAALPQPLKPRVSELESGGRRRKKRTRSLGPK